MLNQSSWHSPSWLKRTTAHSKPKSKRKLVFEEVSSAIERAKHEFKPNCRHDVIRPCRDSNLYLNSVAIFTGAQSSGKTFAALTEALIIARAMPNTHMLIFIKKKQYDNTVEALRPLIENTGCKFVDIGYDEAEAFVKQIFACKSAYNLAKRAISFHRSGRDMGDFNEDITGITDDYMAQMLDVLGVPDLRHDWLNTLIVFDDAGFSGLFKNNDSYFNNRLKLCRDDNAVYFITIHGITQLYPYIKQNTATVHVFKGLSNERLAIVHRQLNIPLEWRQFKEAYRSIGKRGCRFMIFDNISGVEPKIE
jgi:hypothetical protein